MLDTLLKAIEIRRRAFVLNDSSAVRLLTAQEGIAGLVIERYGETIVFQTFDDSAINKLESLIPVLREEVAARSFIVKQFARNPNAVDKFERSIHFAGDAPSESKVIVENGLRFIIRPNDGFSTGLFLDQRSNRAFLADLCKPGFRVLNLFSYSCSFSVYCASRGAKTVSVDISKKALEWGKSNFEKNSISLTNHRFFCRDSMDYLAQNSGKFDLIIIDPPSFSRNSNGRVFSIQTDFQRLVELCTLHAKGLIFFSTNSVAMIEQGLPNKIGRFSRQKMPALPADFLPGKPSIAYELYG